MGGSVSKNATDVVIKAVVKISSKIVQDTKISYDSSQVIYIKDIAGDVIIRGNKMIQHATVNMQALFNALSSETAQQNLALELAQSAKALTAGLNLGQFSYAENDMNIFIQTSIELATEISQSCAEMAKQEQKIVIEHVKGSVVIENNVFEQMANLMETCLQTSISNSNALQSIILKLTQDSSATSQGLSEWALVAVLAILVGAPTIAVTVIGKDVLNYLFPIMMVAGVVMVIIYYATKKQSMPVKAYSSFIDKTPSCLADPSHPPPKLTYTTAEAAGNFCQQDPTCAAFDWKGIDITNTGSYTPVNPPETRIYKSVSSDCRTKIGEDNVNMLRAPVVFFGASTPPSSIQGLLKGDVWIDTRTSAWHQLITAWASKGTIIPDHFTKLTIQKTDPTTQSGIDGEYVISYTEDDPEYFNIYAQQNGRWNYKAAVRGPGMFAAAPPITNASGVKEDTGKLWLLYGGIGAAILGLGGTIVTTVYGSKTANSNQPPSIESSKGKM